MRVYSQSQYSSLILFPFKYFTFGCLADYINYNNFLGNGNADKEYTKQNSSAVIDIIKAKGNKLNDII